MLFALKLTLVYTVSINIRKTSDDERRFDITLKSQITLEKTTL